MRGATVGKKTATLLQIFTVVGCEVHMETRLGGLGLLYGMAFGRGITWRRFFFFCRCCHLLRLRSVGCYM
jgi:hypothetical protein